MTLDAIPPEAPPNCPLCPRLVLYREANAQGNPDWFNGAVPSFGDENARLLVAGLAPGRTGANRTGRPFTGDGAGVLLYETLIKTGFATGKYEARPDDSVRLVDCMITNAVRCAPPGNKPETQEEANCRPFLRARIEALPNLKVIVTLGDWAVERPYRDYAAYFPSKGAIPTLTRTFAVELGTRNPRVRVNCVLPGPVMLPADLPEYERRQAIDATLVKREGSPENVALAVLALVANDFVTGACLPVDGGRSIYAPEDA